MCQLGDASARRAGLPKTVDARANSAAQKRERRQRAAEPEDGAMADLYMVV